MVHEMIKNETDADRIEKFNKLWLNKSPSIDMGDGVLLTLPEYYEKLREVSRANFEETKKILDQNIPLESGKKILYVNMVINGTMRASEIKHIDKKWLAQVYETETGYRDLTQDFQPANMRHMLGIHDSLEYDETRFEEWNPFLDPIPEDLSKYAGIVLSGSETNVLGEEHKDRIEMTERVKEFIIKTSKLDIPTLAICFGAQLRCAVEGMEVNWVEDKNGKRCRDGGIVRMILTNEGIDHPLFNKIPVKDVMYGAENHEQKISTRKIPKNIKVLATNPEENAVEVAVIGKNTICLQRHPEVGTGRYKMLKEIIPELSAPNNALKDMLLEKGNKVFFHYFLNKCGEYLKTEHN